jgi:branched-chain amino acid transport system ATP-binding protein
VDEPLLALAGVQAWYGRFQALFDITLHVDRGEIVTLVGGNGAGKTTILRVISGMLHPKAGTVRCLSHDLSRRAPHEIVALGLSHVPEGRQLFPHMSVEENLALGAYVERARPRAGATLEAQYEFFPRLKDRRKQLAGTLSGGEQQMVAIARALMSDPAVLLLDEPSLGLAPKIVEEVFAKVKDIGARGLTVLIVEQNVVESLAIANRAYVIEHGAVDTSVGTAPGDLLKDRRLRAAYFGLE